MNLPTREQCMKMLREHDLTEGMIAHTKVVEKISNYLGKKFIEAGIKVDLELIDRAALLHDVDKYETLQGDIRHGERGERIVLEAGYPEIAHIVKEHVLEQILEGLSSWESKIVFYADKRVNHAEIVSLDARFEYLFKRYGSKSKEIMGTLIKCKPKVFELEKELFSKINESPELKGLKLE